MRLLGLLLILLASGCGQQPDGQEIDLADLTPLPADRPAGVEPLRSPSFDMPSAVVGPVLRPQLRARLEEALLRMREDPEGRRALEKLGIEGLVLIDDDAYDSVRDLPRSVGVGGNEDGQP